MRKKFTYKPNTSKTRHDRFEGAMLLLRIFRRILCIIFIVKATVGQKNEQQRQQHELVLPDSATTFVRHLWHTSPSYYDRKSLMHKQYESEEPTHRFEQRKQQQPENGNSLAPKEIAMEILSEAFPADTKSFGDIFKRLQLQQRSPDYWRQLNDISSMRTNFRASPLCAQRKQAQEMEKLHSENSNWHENAKGSELIADFAPVDNDASEIDDTGSRAIVRDPRAQSDAVHMAYYDTVDDGDDDDAYTNSEHKLIDNFMKSNPTTDAAAAADNAAAVESIFRGPVMTRKNNEPFGEMNKGNMMKRNPLGMDNYRYAFAQPHYPFALYSAASSEAGQKSSVSPMKSRSTKRERTPAERTPFLPSISAGAMTNLGTFFGDLSKNVRFNEQQDIHEAKAKLLEGDHPLKKLREAIEVEPDEETQFLHAIRSYRPSQRIRSLVSMTPQGYHGSNFLDPNYMWVGLG